MQNTRTFAHTVSTCKRIQCRNAQHYKLFNSENKEIKDTFERIEMMRSAWHKN